MKTTKNLVAAAVAATLGLSVSTAGAQPDPTSAEFLHQPGLGAINILPAWGQGLTGQGITVAVLDTGIRATHQDLAANVLPGGFDFVNNDADPNDDDATETGGHGTAMSGIVAAAFNDFGQVGVAYDAKILPYKIVTADGSATSAVAAAGIQAAASSSAQILVMAYRSDSSDAAAEIAALQAAAAAGKIIVIAAGNEGRPEPRFPANQTPNLGGLGITVGAVDGTGSAILSNRAGSNTSFMVAPGVAIVSTGNGSDTAFTPPLTGASMAAPHVAGAAALLLQAAPNLTPQQVVEILLTTARDVGDPGFDPVYGHGMLDVGNALAPIGELNVANGSGGGGGGGAALGVAAAGVLAALVVRGNKLEKTLVVDRYNRPYLTDLRDWLWTPVRRPTLANLFEAERFRQDGFQFEWGRQRLWLGALQASAALADGFNEFARRRQLEDRPLDLALSWTGATAGGLDYRLDLNQDPRPAYGALAGERPVGFLTGDSLTAPYLGFVRRGDSIQLGGRLAGDTRWRLGAARFGEDGAHGRDSTAAIVEGRRPVGRRGMLALSLGRLAERGGLLGGVAGGPFGVDRADTTALGLSGRYDLGARFSLVGHYSEGYTRIRNGAGALLRDYTTLRSNAFGLALVGHDLWRLGDRFGLAVTRPLRIQGGSAELVVPERMDRHGKIYYSDGERINLNPDGQEVDMEVTYQWRVTRYTQVAGYFLYQHEPLHVKGADDGYTVYTVLRHEF